ncbi:hypothetical protein Q7P37_009607 [Cladosporium fusiforme]
MQITHSSPSLLLLLAIGLASPAKASYCFFVGKNLTEDGSVMVAGTGEEVSGHWLQLFPAQDHAPNATISVGVTEDAALPGKRIQIPQAKRTYRYLSMEYSDFEGFPAPLTNGGLNEHGVAVRDVWAQNREELVAMTPNPQTGVNYGELARIVMERARTAREGVEIIGQLMDEYGEATYGGNTHLIADKDEGWVVWEFAGGKHLWAAERLGDNDIRVLYPGYIEDFPVNFMNSSDYMGAPHLVDFAVEQGWWDPNGNKSFNIWEVYGDTSNNATARNGGYKYMSQGELEDATRDMVPITEKKLMERHRDIRIADDQSGYGQVLSLHDGIDSDMLRIWIAPTGAVAAPFIPWWIGVQSIPPEAGLHRYLYDQASSKFLNTDYQYQEASEFVFRIFKRVLYYMCAKPKEYHPTVTDMLVGFENQSFTEVESWVERGAQVLIDNGERESAQELLTYYSHSRLYKALDLGKTIASALDSHLKLTRQWRNPRGDLINDGGSGNATVTCLIGINPDRPKWDQQG